MVPRARHFLIGFMLAVLGLMAMPIQARDTGFPAGSSCYRTAAPQASPEALARTRDGWSCAPRDWAIDGHRASLVRIDMTGRSLTQGAVMTTRLTLFRELSITALGANGESLTRTIHQSDLTLSRTGWEMRMPLPRLSGPVEAYVFRVTGPRHIGMLSDIAIGPAPDEASVSNYQLLLAALCGLMCMPLILNFAFYRILRERFILWHAAAVLVMLTQMVVTSGLIQRFCNLSLLQTCVLSSLSLSLTAVATVRFFVTLIEPDILGKRLRMTLELLVPWIGFWTAYYLLADGPFLASIAPLYYLAFLPFIVMLVFTVIFAATRGSRTAWFQIVGWTPLAMVGLVRIVSMLGATATPLGLGLEQNLAIAFEVIVTSLGVADRFMTIRLQRDQALAQAEQHATLAKRDALTGLWNRRAIEEQFEALYRSGFRTMAALDLDHFKRINDIHGHAAGDAVLKAVAEALMPDDDTVAIRMGGEEFVLLLRGDDAPERAERRRQAIPSRVAKRHPGLHRLVTASMGVVTFDDQAQAQPSFSEIYNACDRLLYASKKAGRDRMSSSAATGGHIGIAGEAASSLRKGLNG